MTNMATAFEERDGRLSSSWLPTSSDRSEDATVGSGGGGKELEVGTFLFERDSQYLQFLNTLFAVIILPLQVEDQHTPSHSTPPTASLMSLSDHDADPVFKLSERQPDPPKGDDSHVSTSLYPLLDLLIKWSQKPYPLKSDRGKNGDVGLRESVGQRKIAKRRIRLGCSSMRVNLSAPIIISCLRRRENKYHDFRKEIEEKSESVMGKHVREGEGEGNIVGEGEVSEPLITRLEEDSSSELTISSRAPDSVNGMMVGKGKDMGTSTERDCALMLKENEDRRCHFDVDGTVTDTIGEPCSRMRSPTLLGGVAKDECGFVHLLRVPEGVLQVQVISRAHMYATTAP